MVENNPPAPADRSHTPVIPLPTALYVSGELIFELYDGGQPRLAFATLWPIIAYVRPQHSCVMPWASAQS
jgi:hypothetical protein